jgi:hypothetical protein
MLEHEVDTTLENVIFKYLMSYKFLGRMHKRKSDNTYILGLLISIETCLEQIAYQFPQLRTPIIVKRWGREQLEYFECGLSKNDLLKLFEKHHIDVFKSVDDFSKKKNDFDERSDESVHALELERYFTNTKSLLKVS